MISKNLLIQSIILAESVNTLLTIFSKAEVISWLYKLYVKIKLSAYFVWLTSFVTKTNIFINLNFNETQFYKKLKTIEFCVIKTHAKHH